MIRHMNLPEAYLSREKHTELEAELKSLKSVRRKEIAEQLEYAKSLGDLSENAEYHDAREAQAALEEKISKLEDILRRATIGDSRKHSSISVGSTVVLQKAGSKMKEEWAIVGSEEADMALRQLSNESPLGAALMGKKKGDEISVRTPIGEICYFIMEIR